MLKKFKRVEGTHLEVTQKITRWTRVLREMGLKVEFVVAAVRQNEVYDLTFTISR